MLGSRHCEGLTNCYTCHATAVQAEDVTSLTQQLQLLHVTKEFQQQVKAGSSAGASGSGANVAAAATGDAAGATAAANKEVSSLENLLKVNSNRVGAVLVLASCKMVTVTPEIT